MGKKPTALDYSKKLGIDRNALDSEIVEQPELLYRVGQAAALAVSQRDELIEGLKHTDAALNLTIRKDYEEAGGRFTEAMISAAVLTDFKHIKSYDLLAESKLKCDNLAALRDAFNSRGFMLRDLVQLHISGYFSSTSVQDEARRTSKPQVRVVNKGR